MITFPPLVQSRAVDCCAETFAVVIVALFAIIFESVFILSDVLIVVGFAGGDDGDDAI